MREREPGFIPDGPEKDLPQWLERFQSWLDRVNRRAGSVGSVVVTAILTVTLIYALLVILRGYFDW